MSYKLKDIHLDQAVELIDSHSIKNQNFERFGFGWSRNQLKLSLQTDLCFGIFLNDQLVAILLGRLVDHIYEIDLTMTHKKYLRQGLMSSLFQSVFSSLRDRGILKVWLEVHEENTSAIALYKAQGFVEEGVRPRYYPDQKAAILMTCML